MGEHWLATYAVLALGGTHERLHHERLGSLGRPGRHLHRRGGARPRRAHIRTLKLLSEAPGQYADAAVEAIGRLLGDTPRSRQAAIGAVKMGTTVATNALLERKGEPTLLAITAGLGDALRIGDQSRPKIFARQIVLPEPLYAEVLEVPERLTAEGEVLTPLDEVAVRAGLVAAYARGLRAVAVVLMHGWRFTAHEARVAEIAREVGFTQVSASHDVGALMKLVPRGDTTVVDAYLSPILRRYVAQVADALGGVRLLFMAVQRRAGGGRSLPRARRRAVGAGGRYRRHGQDR